MTTRRHARCLGHAGEPPRRARHARRLLADACASRGIVLALAALAGVLAGGCEREKRQLELPASASMVVPALRMSSITPGGPGGAPPVTNAYDENAYALAEGKRLFNWYNCNGCHADGGGAQGPPLMDDLWIYGSSPANVYASIVQGRPNGMPSWAGRIPENEVWELVAYVRSMSGLADRSAAPSRNDALQTKPAENRMERQPPVPSGTPPASERPS
jgi:cytochrome c oxidase cbb3-type subunit 3